jgi:hypothetical protein
MRLYKRFDLVSPTIISESIKKRKMQELHRYVIRKKAYSNQSPVVSPVGPQNSSARNRVQSSPARVTRKESRRPLAANSRQVPVSGQLKLPTLDMRPVPREPLKKVLPKTATPAVQTKKNARRTAIFDVAPPPPLSALQRRAHESDSPLAGMNIFSLDHELPDSVNNDSLPDASVATRSRSSSNHNAQPSPANGLPGSRSKEVSSTKDASETSKSLVAVIPSKDVLVNNGLDIPVRLNYVNAAPEKDNDDGLTTNATEERSNSVEGSVSKSQPEVPSVGGSVSEERTNDEPVSEEEVEGDRRLYEGHSEPSPGDLGPGKKVVGTPKREAQNGSATRTTGEHRRLVETTGSEVTPPMDRSVVQNKTLRHRQDTGTMPETLTGSIETVAISNDGLEDDENSFHSDQDSDIVVINVVHRPPVPHVTREERMKILEELYKPPPKKRTLPGESADEDEDEDDEEVGDIIVQSDDGPPTKKARQDGGVPQVEGAHQSMSDDEFYANEESPNQDDGINEYLNRRPMGWTKQTQQAVEILRSSEGPSNNELSSDEHEGYIEFFSPINDGELHRREPSLELVSSIDDDNASVSWDGEGSSGPEVRGFRYGKEVAEVSKLQSGQEFAPLDSAVAETVIPDDAGFYGRQEEVAAECEQICTKESFESLGQENFTKLQAEFPGEDEKSIRLALWATSCDFNAAQRYLLMVNDGVEPVGDGIWSKYEDELLLRFVKGQATDQESECIHAKQDSLQRYYFLNCM